MLCDLLDKWLRLWSVKFCKINRNFQNKMRNIQEKLLKVSHFILKSSVNFPDSVQ